MPLAAARRSRLLNSVARIGAFTGVAGFLLFAASGSLQSASAEGETRTLTFHHLHTGENITITYMRDGRYDDEALKKLDWFMRDWRKGKSTRMDPQLYDVLWQAYRELGATRPIEIVCGYRSPGTNAMLRARSSGVAEFSQHTLGHAMDFYIPGANLEKLREIGMRLQAGGVGFYPTSGSPFVHMDTGSIRHWPRMTYAQLTRVFPDGKTVHVAADGRPLPHFAEALAEVARHGRAPNGIALAQARAHGAVTERQVQIAEAAARGPEQPSLLAKLFGARRAEPQTTAAIATNTKTARLQVASAAPEKSVKAGPSISARPKVVAVADASASIVPANLMALAAPDALSGRSAFVTKILPFDVASAASSAFAYAPEEVAPVRGKPWLAAPVAAEPPPQTAAVAAPETFDRMISGAQRLDSPWLRAAMLTASVSTELTVTQFGGTDPRVFGSLFSKPKEALAMAFSDEPALSTDRFTGSAVVFLATDTFVRAQTASLSLPNAQ